MRSMIKPALSLLIICLGVGICLSFVNSLTRGVIENRASKDAENQRKEVLPDAESFEKIKDWENKTSGSGIIREVYKGIASGKTSGFVFSVCPKGYAGEIKVTVGVGLDGRATGVKMGENKETPGLGSKAAEPDFIGQYKGKKLDGKELEVVKKKPSADNEVQAISGATITSRAVTSAVQAAAELAKELIKEEVGGK